MAEKKIVKNDFKEAKLKYPKLKLFWEDEIFLCLGEVDIFDDENEYWDTFSIKISIPIKPYPHFFPVLYLTNERIPIDDDRHIHSDSSCCVEVEQKQLLRKKKGITIVQFLDEYVVPYLADQLYYEKEDDWANGDYLHDFQGKIQYYSEVTGTADLKDMVHILKNLDRISTIGMYDPCFCNSGRKLKYCHRDAVKKLLQLPCKYVEDDIEKMEEQLRLNID